MECLAKKESYRTDKYLYGAHVKCQDSFGMDYLFSSTRPKKKRRYRIFHFNVFLQKRINTET